MTDIKIFEPALCCPTGLCGARIDPELLRISTVLFRLKKAGFTVARYNLSNAPLAFAAEPAVAALLKAEGASVLPAVLVDGEIRIKGRYPEEAELAAWLGTPAEKGDA
jgi:hypothetical protein